MNKRTLDAEERIRRTGLKPLEAMCALAQNDDTLIELRVKLLRELSSYVFSKRKSIEVQSTNVAIGLIEIFEANLQNSKFRQAAALNQPGRITEHESD